jgi:hypothetical protein
MTLLQITIVASTDLNFIQIITIAITFHPRPRTHHITAQHGHFHPLKGYAYSAEEFLDQGLLEQSVPGQNRTPDSKQVPQLGG